MSLKRKFSEIFRKYHRHTGLRVYNKSVDMATRDTCASPLPRRKTKKEGCKMSSKNRHKAHPQRDASSVKEMTVEELHQQDTDVTNSKLAPAATVVAEEDGAEEETMEPVTTANTQTLSVEQVAAVSLFDLARAEIADQNLLQRLSEEKSQIAELLRAASIEVPEDEEGIGYKTATKKKPVTKTPSSNGSSSDGGGRTGKRGRPAGSSAGGGLRGLVTGWMFDHGYVVPNFVEVGMINKFAKEHDYVGAAALLVTMTKEETMVKDSERRGYYALPRGFRPKAV